MSAIIFFIQSLFLKSVNLDASKSYDPDGQIVWQKWEQVSGPKSFIEDDSKLKTRALLTKKGVYQFKLTVIDNENAVTSKVIQKVKA